jgi:DNA-binding transcriptional LysR family regulator
MDALTRMASSVAAVLQVARWGSFRAAMRNGGTSFRTLDQQIKDLEKDLGFMIFRRTGVGIIPTPEGEAVLEQARVIEHALARIQRLGKTLTARAEGDVTLAATEGLGTFWITPRLQTFNATHPKVSVQLNSSMNIADMRRLDTDIALQVIEPVLPEIKRTRICTLHLILCASKRYLDVHGAPKTLNELKDHRFVIQSNPQFSDRLVLEQALGARIPKSQLMVMRSSSSHYITIENGAGIGFLPSYGFVVGASVVPVMMQVRYELDVWLCFHADSRSLPRVGVTLDWLNELFDPKLYPWFRREFVAPQDFRKVVGDERWQQDIEPYVFSHG